MDCAANEQLCKEQAVHAFPTLRLFNRRTGLAPDYNSVRAAWSLLPDQDDKRAQLFLDDILSHSPSRTRCTMQMDGQDRTVDSLSTFITRKLNIEEKRKNWPERDKEYVEYPGCMVSESVREGGRALAGRLFPHMLPSMHACMHACGLFAGRSACLPAC